MGELIDLHVHTTRSDGLYPAGDLLGILAKAGVGKAAIVDHDTLWGYRDGIEPARGLGISLYPGIEISTSFKVGGEFVEEVHLLWYGMDVQAPDVLKFEETIKELQNDRASRMVARLCESGLDLDFDKMVRVSNPVPAGVPQIVFQMLQRGLLAVDADEIKDFFLSYLGPGGTVYEPPEPVLEKVASEIKELGGQIVIAHPVKIEDERALKAMLEFSDGIEVYYASHSEGDIERFGVLARERGLLMSGGTDYHGYYEPGYQPLVLDEQAEREIARFLGSLTF